MSNAFLFFGPASGSGFGISSGEPSENDNLDVGRRRPVAVDEDEVGRWEDVGREAPPARDTGRGSSKGVAGLAETDSESRGGKEGVVGVVANGEEDASVPL